MKTIFLAVVLLCCTCLEASAEDRRVVVKNQRGQITQVWRTQGNRTTITDRNGRITGYARVSGNVVTTYDRNGRRK